MPMRAQVNTVSGQVYGRSVVGVLEHTAQRALNVSLLTVNEVDSDGYLKPGVPFDVNGLLVGAGLVVAPGGVSATPVVGGGTFAAATYYWKVSALGTGGESLPSVEVSAVIALNGSATIAWAAVTGATGYKIYRGTAAGAENAMFTVGVVTTFTDTGAAGTAGTVLTTSTITPVAVYGVTIEPIKVAVSNDAASLTTAGTAVQITLQIIGMVNRKIAEDDLGRAYTAAEVAGFDLAGSHIKLLY